MFAPKGEAAMLYRTEFGEASSFSKIPILLRISGRKYAPILPSTEGKMYNRHMFRKSDTAGFSTRESRTLNLFKEVGPNIGTWGKDVGSTYLAQGWKEKDPIKVVAGVPMAAASTLFESLDYVYAGIADQKLETPTGSRTLRDIKEIGTNHVRHPIRTVLSGLRLISDVPMDIADGVIGFKHGGSAVRAQTRHQISEALAA